MTGSTNHSLSSSDPRSENRPLVEAANWRRAMLALWLLWGWMFLNWEIKSFLAAIIVLVTVLSVKSVTCLGPWLPLEGRRDKNVESELLSPSTSKSRLGHQRGQDGEKHCKVFWIKTWPALSVRLISSDHLLPSSPMDCSSYCTAASGEQTIVCCNLSTKMRKGRTCETV